MTIRNVGQNLTGKSAKRSIKEALAIWAVMEDVSISPEHLAEFAGCSRTSLYRMPKLRRIWSILKTQGTAALPRGNKTVNKSEHRNDLPMEFEAWETSGGEE
jgi:hypothetical protein